MGGGGRYFDRDIPDRSTLNSRGISRDTEQQMSRRNLDPAVDPRNRRLVCQAESPVCYAFDVTGSMGDKPKFIRQKGPLLAKELTDRQYLKGVEMSIAAIGDLHEGDRAPCQIGDFTAVRGLDVWMRKLWLEGGGGGNGMESYDFAAYYYAYLCEMPNAVTPVMLFTGDEGLYDSLPGSDLRRVFGGEHRDTDTAKVFRDLTAKFKGNVFLLHSYYSDDEGVLRQWRQYVEDGRIIRLQSDRALMDVTIGVFALVSGARNLDGYCEDMRTRTNATTGKVEPQSVERIAEVKETLSSLAEYLASRRPALAPAKAARRRQAASKVEAATPDKPKKPPRKRKPGRF
jgi:hypothetical protein